MDFRQTYKKGIPEERIYQLKQEIESQKSPLQKIISSRALELITDSNNKTYFLSVDVLARGSQRKTETFLSNRLRHSGGVIVKHIIYDQSASIVLSNVHHSYTGFRKVRTSK